MSWHTSLIFIQQSKPDNVTELLGKLGFPNHQPGEVISFEDATSTHAPGKSVAHLNGWTILGDPLLFTSLDSVKQPDNSLWSPTIDKALCEISGSGAFVFGLITEGATGLHGFTTYQKGARTQVLSSAISMSG